MEDSEGLIGLGYYTGGARCFYSSRPITCLADLAGMDIRVQESEIMMGMIDAWGLILPPLPTLRCTLPFRPALWMQQKTALVPMFPPLTARWHLISCWITMCLPLICWS